MPAGPAPHTGCAVLTRRSLLQRAGMIALGTANSPEVLAACGSSGRTSASAPAATTKVALQLNYLENVPFSGTLLALHNGYYHAEGLDVTVLPGGPNLAPEPGVMSGKALVGITHTQEGAQPVLHGADLKIVGAAFQKSPTWASSTGHRGERASLEIISQPG